MLSGTPKNGKVCCQAVVRAAQLQQSTAWVVNELRCTVARHGSLGDASFASRS